MDKLTNVKINKLDEMTMRLLHYFINEENYTPIILHGVKNEVWLENLDAKYRIIRIVTNYIHNDEQFDYDMLKTKHIAKRIKKKTFSFKINVFSIFMNIGDNVTNLEYDDPTLDSVLIKTEKDFLKKNILTELYPNIKNETDIKEKGVELFMKLTNEINDKNTVESMKAENVFTKKLPLITYILLAINLIIFILCRLNINNLNYFVLANSNIIGNEYYRLLTSVFTHYSFLHFFFNMYALYIIGEQLESYIGKFKYLTIYLISGITSSLLSMVFLDNNSLSLGASGAIFGLLGSLIYFGYYYRVYLSSVLKSQLIPLVCINLLIGFMMPGIDNAAHIGGLIGGILATMFLGIKYKSKTYERVNGLIVLLMYIAFIGYLAFFR